VPPVVKPTVSPDRRCGTVQDRDTQSDGSDTLTASRLAVFAAALAACGTGGVIADPLACHYNADALICQGTASDPATCLTPVQAEANMIWDGR
jgi:hypothetical protein